MAGELGRIRQANQDRYLRVFNPGDILTALMLLERAAGVTLEVQNITGQDYGAVWLEDYKKALWGE